MRRTHNRIKDFYRYRYDSRLLFNSL